MKLKRIACMLLSVATVLTLSVPVFATDNTLDASFQKTAQKALDDSKAVSLQYAIWDNGTVAYTGHAGTYSKTENRALTPDNLYGIGSVSKMYLTASVMKLAEQGKIDLDKSVTTYIPEFKMADPRYKDITVRMLLNHSSGLLGSSLGNASLIGDPTSNVAADQLLDRLKDQTLKDDPGAFSVYCNDGFTLAQLVVERVSGKRFGDFLHQEILAPMSLKDTFVPSDFTAKGFDESRIAKIYSGTNTKALPPETFSAVGTGGIYATASDLAAFGGQLYQSGVLNEKSLSAMSSAEYAKGIWPADTEDEISYGLGWDSVKFYPFAYSDIQALVKGGDTMHYHAGLLVIPQYKISVAVVSSDGISTYDEAAAARMALDLLKSKGISVDDTAKSIPESAAAPMPADLTNMSGYYVNSNLSGNVEVKEDGTLTITTAYGSQSLTYRADGTFRDDKNTLAVKFVKEKNGQIYLWQKSYTDVPGLIQMPTSAYIYQKAPDNPVSQTVQTAWDNRNSKIYLNLTERFTSEAYPTGLPMARISTVGSAPGYMVFDKMVDADHVEGVARIPGNAGRDWQNLTMKKVGNGEYLSYSGQVYQDSDSLPDIWLGNSICTISNKGDTAGLARWCKVGKAAHKTMTVTVPKNGAFYVYDGKGMPAAGSWAWGDTSVVLPVDGYIVFVGDPGAQFTVNMK